MCIKEVSSANGASDASQASAFDKVGTKVAAEQLLAEQAVDPDIVQEFVCKICLVNVVGAKPKLTCCSHFFCGDCLDRWFALFPSNQSWAQRARSGGAVPCPVCKTPLRNGDVFPVEDGSGTGALLYRMICSLQIACVNHVHVTTDGCCSWTGSLGDYKAHLAVCGKEEPAVEAVKPLEELAAQPGKVSVSAGVTRPDAALEDNGARRQPRNEVKADGTQRTEEPGQGDGEALAPSLGQAADARQAALKQSKDPHHDAADDFFSDGVASEEQEGEQAEQPEHFKPCCAGGALAQAACESEPQEAVKTSPRPLIPDNASISDCIQTWVQLATAKKHGWSLVTCSYVTTSEHYLSLSVGDMVTVFEKHPSGWTYGRKEFTTDAAPSVPAGAEGWFPDWVLNMRGL